MEVREGSSRKAIIMRRRRRRRQRRILVICMGLILLAAVCGIAFGIRSHMRTKQLLEHRTAGIEQMEEENWEGAIAEFDAALDGLSRIGNRERDVLEYRAEAEYKQGDYDAALHTYDMLLEQEDSGEQADLYRNMRCVCLMELGRYEEALELHLLDGQIYNRMAVEEMEAQRYEEALAYLEQGIAAGQEEALVSLLYNQAAVYERMGEFERALDILEQYAARYGSGPELEKEIAFLKTR